MWIEASWLFRCPATITSFTERVSSECRMNATAKRCQDFLKEALTDINCLSEDLRNLNNSWGHVLCDEPNEIWEPSIPAFTKSRFWMDSDSARVTYLARPKDDRLKSILIQSQVSASGLKISLIRFILPRSISQSVKLQRFSANEVAVR